MTTPITPTQGGTNVYIGAGSGSANAQLVVTPTPLNFALISGYTVNFIPSVSNTTATTLSVAGTTAKAVLRQTASGLQALVGGEIVINQMATVIYDGTQYELINSAVTANVQPCTTIDYAGVGVPSGYLNTDGSAKSRTSFSALFGCLAYTSVSATTTSGNTSVVVPDSTLFQVGWYVGGTNVTCNSTITGSADGTHITISNTAGGNGATTLTIGPYQQGDCSTTFNVPNFLGRAAVAADTAGTTLTSAACSVRTALGGQCGSTTQAIPRASLPTGITSANATQAITVSFGTNLAGTGGTIGTNTYTGSGATNIPNSTQGWTAVTGSNATNNSISVTSSNTSGTPILLQPIGLVLKAIKF